MPRTSWSTLAATCAASPCQEGGGMRITPALEGLTNLSRMETPRKSDRNKSDHGKRPRTAERGGAWAAHGGRPREGGGDGAYMGARVV
ncbi:hypothetical protein F511_18548 [Dorcoceras hygrometricum]|uniref:Uncharacterized protein n=1 Tax=Dorcoceras hygrometricum TaxID=472368 RepID=A0A2Z7AY34_9LAMI|nr:hypothetical protein F511_18548 [Dorcoceras hygrometricum]